VELDLPERIGILAEGDISTLRVVCSDIRFQIGEILIIKPADSYQVFLFRVMNYENILRNIPEASGQIFGSIGNRPIDPNVKMGKRISVLRLTGGVPLNEESIINRK